MLGVLKSVLQQWLSFIELTDVRPLRMWLDGGQCLMTPAVLTGPCSRFLLQVVALGPLLAGGSTPWLCLLRAMFLLRQSCSAARIPRARIPRARAAVMMRKVKKHGFPVSRFVHRFYLNS